MKKAIIHLALIGMLSAGAAFAQDNSAQAPADQSAMHGRRQGMNPENQLAHLTKMLNLTSDQQSQIKPLLETQQSQIMQIHQDQSIAREDKMAKVKSVHQDTTTKIEAVLNDQQKQKYEASQEKMQERMERRSGGDAAPAPQQPQQ